jgi:polysaccharide chain length determinant protein (PEP-CTERM system associated)
LEYKEAQNRRDELRRQLRGEEPTFGMGAPPPSIEQFSGSSALDARIQNLQTRLDDLLLKYTEKHPDVQALKDTIASLEKQKEEELAQMQKGSPAAQSQSLESNPVYQQLKISLGEAEATVAGLKVRVDQFRNEVARLKGAVDTIPEVEAEFKRLNRDYEINKKNYEELVERRESAKLSEQADQTSDNVKFRIIDPPFVPSNPVGPNRPMLISVVLLGALLAGLAFAVFLSQIKPTFDTVRNVTRELGLPVFGSVSRVWTGNTKMKRRAEVLAFGAGGLVLLMLYGGYMSYLIMANKLVG